MGKIFYVMGKSCSGKDSMFKMIHRELPDLCTIIPYTTRPKREDEGEGVEYFFVKEETLSKLAREEKIVEVRSYNTVYGIWRYFTVDDGQINLRTNDYLMIGTLESYESVKKYYGEEKIVPIYVEVEDGERLQRALNREKSQDNPKYAEMCRRFLADSEDFCEENIEKAGIKRRFQNTDKEKCSVEIIDMILGELEK